MPTTLFVSSRAECRITARDSVKSLETGIFAMSSKLFEPSSIGTLRVKNRFVRSATWEGMAGDDGSCTSRLVELTSELAVGEVGLIVSSHAFVSPEGQAGPWQLGIHDDKFTPRSIANGDSGS